MSVFRAFALAAVCTAGSVTGTLAAGPTAEQVLAPPAVSGRAADSLPEGSFQVAAARKYFVVLGAFRSQNAAYGRCSLFGDGQVVSTNEYPNFRNGYWACVIGPLYRNEAEDQMWASKEAVPDAYVKAGW